MAGLKLNGIELPVRVDDFRRDPLVVRDEANAFDGTPRATELDGERSIWTGSLSRQTQDVTHAFRQLIKGAGHSWGFDADLYSAKGLVATAAGGVAWNGSSGKYDGGADVPVGGSLTFPVALGSEWTALLWRKVGVGSYAHYIVRGSAKWLGGARNDAALTGWLVVGASSVTLFGDAASTVSYDDVVLLPFEVPDDWPPEMYAEAAVRAHAALPRLNAEGDLIRGGPVEVLGKPGGSQISPFVSGGVLHLGGEVLSFTLTECNGV